MSGIDRRRTLTGAAAVAVAAPLLAACGDDSPPAGTGSDPGDSGDSGDSGTGGGGTTVPTSDVPQGGGVILADDKIVVTQPEPGEFKAFSAVCTHQGCLVSGVTETIDCNCHGSKFSLTDGAPLEGPATSPLAEKQISVQGDAITLG